MSRSEKVESYYQLTKMGLFFPWLVLNCCNFIGMACICKLCRMSQWLALIHWCLMLSTTSCQSNTKVIIECTINSYAQYNDIVTTVYLYLGMAMFRRADLVQLVSASLPSHQVLGSKPSLCRISAGVRLCFGYSLPQTPLVWEPLALGLPFFWYGHVQYTYSF
jgi:hypothetical protein